MFNHYLTPSGSYSIKGQICFVIVILPDYHAVRYAGMLSGVVDFLGNLGLCRWSSRPAGGRIETTRWILFIRPLCTHWHHRSHFLYQW
jgi:hypothetical protein